LRDTGDLLAAHAAYRDALDEAEAAVQSDSKFQETLDRIKKELESVDAILGRLTVELVHAPDGTTVTVDGRPVDPGQLAEPVLLPPGEIAVEATAPDGTVKRRVVTLFAGQPTTVELAFLRKRTPRKFFSDGGSLAGDDEDAEPKEVADGGGHLPAYVVGGIGIAGLATFAVFGALSSSKFEDLEEACADNHCPPERAGDIDNGKRFQVIANIGLGVGIAGVVTGAGLLVFGGPSTEPAKTAKATLSLGVGLGSVEIGGRF
jgi:hypothetical protein